MRQSLLSRFATRSKRQGQIGQTIVIMAFGFIVLLAFVGIVTDVSLMFVRYTTLRRAVDAAAVAAAGQVRRTLPTDAELAAAGGNQKVADGYAFARNVTNINLAARQFIEFYGLSPSNVAVDSCDTLQGDSTKPGYDPDLLKLLECTSNFQPRKLVRVTAQLQSPTVFLRLIGWGTVTLEASSISETAVLDVVLIFDTAETMLKQTTYNDWAKVPVTDGNGGLTYKPDGSLNTKDNSLRYLPVRVKYGPNWKTESSLGGYWPAASNDWVKTWKNLLGMTQDQIYADTTNFPAIGFTWDSTTSTATQVANAYGDSRAPQRKECTVRFFPYAETVGPNAMKWQTTNGVTVSTDLMNSYDAILKKGSSGSSSFGTRFDGFMPAYDYYGCCNDPNGDFKFDDLICQPFGKVRDATEKFLDHVDFVRGDRVAFVTFDRTAFLIDPDGEKISDPVALKSQTPMITSQADAITALRHIVGVRAEPYYYADTKDLAGIAKTDGLWDAYVTGASAYTGLIGNGVPIRYDSRYDFATSKWVSDVTAPAPDKLAGYNNTALGALNDYPVRYNCYWQNATLEYPFSLFSSQSSQADRTIYGSNAYPYEPIPSDLPAGTGRLNETRWPTPLSAMTTAAVNPGAPIMNPNLNLTPWNNSIKAALPVPPNTVYGIQSANKPLFSYEFRAGCAGNNVGAALREGNNALLDPRTVRLGNTGAVWVMVMLGDGAAGASDPVIRNGNVIPSGNPYGSFVAAPKAGGYGAYGLCPYGTPDDQMGLTAGWKTRPPRCSDDGSEVINGGTRGIMGPTSRHFCKDSAVGDENKSSIDIGVSGPLDDDCATRYDVDDYARDWADFIGLTKLPYVSPFCKIQGGQGCDASRSLLQLPTIFTIGFGLDFTESYVPAQGKCSNSNGGGGGVPDEYTNINDCLGEELLRYIADVGDNNRIDTDYQQDYLNDGFINGNLEDLSAPGFVSYGDRGPCEAPIQGYANADSVPVGQINKLRLYPLDPTVSCGNYYNAPGGPQLTQVFEDIASRMFTRITK